MIDRDMSEVRHSDQLTPEEKRLRLDGLIAERNALLKMTTAEVKQ